MFVFLFTQDKKLVTMWDGARPSPGYVPMKKQGAIILGTGGDGSNGGTGTYLEGAMTSGVPTDEVDDAIQANIIAAEYGHTTSQVFMHSSTDAKGSLFNTHFDAAAARVLISYTLVDTRRVKVTIFDQQGKQISSIVNNIKPAGQYNAVWDTKLVSAGVYIIKMTVDNHAGWVGKVVIGK